MSCECSCCGVAKTGVQGIVELVLRIICLVSSIIVAFCAIGALLYFATLITLNIRPVAMDEAGVTLLANAEAGAGWVTVVGIVALLLESVMLGRFCCTCGACNTTAFLIVDIVISLLAAFGMLCGVIAIAAYIPSIREIEIRSDPPNPELDAYAEYQNSIVTTLAALAATGFWTVLMLVILSVFMILSLVLKWKNTNK